MMRLMTYEGCGTFEETLISDDSELGSILSDVIYRCCEDG